MDAFLDLAIRERLAEFVTGHLSRHRFEDWFAPVAMDVEASGNPGAITLAHLIDLRLSELTDGYWTETELRQMLAPHANLHVISSDARITQAARTWTTSAAKPMQRQLVAVLR